MEIKNRIIDILGLVIFLAVCIYALIIIAMFSVFDEIDKVLHRKKEVEDDYYM